MKGSVDYVLSHDEKRLFLFKAGKDNIIPDVMIKANDGLTLSESQSVAFVQIKKTGGWNEDAIFGALKQKGVDMKAVAGKFLSASPDCFYFFKMEDTNAFNEIEAKDIYFRFLSLVDNQGLYEKVFHSAYKPDLAQCQSGGANLIIPDKTRKSGRAAILSDFETAHERLIEYGFGELVRNVNISFRVLPERVMGRHHINTKDVEITLKKSGLIRQMAIVHEFGHVLWQNKMDEDDRDLIQDKFIALLRSHTHINDAKMRKERSYKASGIDEYKIGDELQYIGPKRDIYGQIGVLTNVFDNKFSIEFDSGILTGDVRGMGRFKRPDEPEPLLSLGERDDAIAHKMYFYDGWFPSNYSEIRTEEWFCENFTFIAFGYAQNQDLLNFYENILDKHRLHPRQDLTQETEVQESNLNAIGQYGFGF